MSYGAVKVECYSVQLGDRSHFVEDVVDHWNATGGAYFKVRADEATVYLLRHDTTA